MCGRFALYEDAQTLATVFGLDAAWFAGLPRRYNIPPGTAILALTADERGSQPITRLLRWGLIPHWAKTPGEEIAKLISGESGPAAMLGSTGEGSGDRGRAMSKSRSGGTSGAGGASGGSGYRMVNARLESAAQKPAYRGPFRYRRCIIPASGFFEWSSGSGPKRPHYIQRADGRPMALAALWDQWPSPDGSSLDSCAILTTEAHGKMQELHHRSPVILEPDQIASWVDPRLQDVDRITGLALADPPELKLYPVSTRVNKPRNDDPGNIEPLDPEQPPESGRQGTLF